MPSAEGGPAPVDAGPSLSLCAALGFALAGVCDAAPTAWREELLDWLAAGKHGSMGYLAKHIDARCDPAGVLPGARSVLMVADQYASRTDTDPPSHAAPGRAQGSVARYAQGRDYHRTIKRRLHALCDALRERFPGAEFRAFTDTAPVLEREYAVRSGLGWTGKHTLLISPARGSYMLLGGVLTTLHIKPSGAPEPDHCGTCTRCIDACPTGAITPYSVDASRCISYLTIERRERIDPVFFPAIDGMFFGCDICQEVCPHNTPPRASARAERLAAMGEAHPAYTPVRRGLDAAHVLGWTEDDRRTACTASAMKRATLAMFRRNALIVLGGALQHGQALEHRPRIEAIAADVNEDPLVRETARDVLVWVDSVPAGPPAV